MREKGIGLVIVGPEGPLAEGIVDRFQEMGVPTFGPSRRAAEIESSKAFTKDLLQKYGIAAARSATFTDYRLARDYIERQPLPVVIKADGLAAGKGVVIAGSVAEAQEALADMMLKKSLGAAGDKIVVEECLVGREMSYFVFTDGEMLVPMVAACDYKRIYDGNRGPNTGGMGAYSPPVFYTPELGEMVKRTIMAPVINAMKKEGRPYQGVLYGGLMVTAEGPKVLEFNARFGDPETQVVLPRLKSDLVEIMLAAIEGRLNQVNIEWSEEPCVGVVLASGGYPGSHRTGLPISGLDSLDVDIMVFHAGTKPGGDGQVLTSGGRVLTVAARGRNLAEAREKVYHNIPRIKFEGGYCRRDIAEFNEGA